ncbi:MAG: hypothetical protein WCX45_05600, partial [Candidatus Gracilibacteria bacterium]
MTNHQSRIEKLISELCPNGVEILTVNETCSIRIGDRLEKSAMSNDGNTPFQDFESARRIGYGGKEKKQVLSHNKKRDDERGLNHHHS